MKLANHSHKTLFGAVLPLLTLLASITLIQAQSASRIAFCGFLGGGGSQISSINPDGTGLTQLTSASTDSFAPRWSPGQRYIAFWRDHSLYVMEAIGEANGGRSFVVAPAGFAGSAWSPDGSKLVFMGATGGLYIVSVNAATGTVGTPALFRAGYC